AVVVHRQHPCLRSPGPAGDGAYWNGCGWGGSILLADHGLTGGSLLRADNHCSIGARKKSEGARTEMFRPPRFSPAQQVRLEKLACFLQPLPCPHQTVLVQLFVERHAADPQFGGSP